MKRAWQLENGAYLRADLRLFSPLSHGSRPGPFAGHPTRRSSSQLFVQAAFLAEPSSTSGDPRRRYFRIFIHPARHIPVTTPRLRTVRASKPELRGLLSRTSGGCLIPPCELAVPLRATPVLSLPVL